MSVIPTDPIWVDNAAQLAELCSRWRQQAAIAVDTEFMRSDTFYPIAGLIQVGDGKGCYLIDPLAFADLSPLAAVMTDPRVIKVLHACSEDLEVFQVLWGEVPSPIFDTQIAAAFSGLGYSLGYAALVKSLLMLDIPKGETRSDWLARPLSVAQQEYAALDVAHMLIIYGKLLQQLKVLDRLSWVQADCATLVEAAGKPQDFSVAYQKVGIGWKLDPRGLAVLRAISEWREEEARARDIPRNRLMKEVQLYEIARRQPGSVGQLQRIEGLPRRTIHDDADQLLLLVAEASALDENELPARMAPPLTRELGPLMKTLKEYVREVAEPLGLPPELLIRKKEYEDLIRSGTEGGEFVLPERLNGWRYAVIGAGLLDVARRELEVGA